MAYTIMIVDDSSTIREVLEKTIELTKLPVIQIHQAIHGKDALEKLATQWVDIIFTDINMPCMNGIEFLDVLNKDKELREIPVVVISTEGSKTRIEDLRRKGIKGYIRKPFTPEHIRNVIIETLGGWDAQSS